MAIFQVAHLATTFGILGNIVSFLVFLAPVPTFYRICKKKSTEGFQSIPYAVALLSSMLYLYYAFLKKNALLLITINSVGTVMEVAYLTLFIIYATKQSRIFTIKMLLLFNVTLLGLIVACTHFLLKGHFRVTTVGWICATFSVSVFAAPLSIMRQVIRTKSVEYMPLSLSFFLTLCAVIWFFYGLLIHDHFIAAPNVIGFTFGIAQMTLYAMYKNQKQQILPEIKVHDFKTTKNITMEIKEVDRSVEDLTNELKKEREFEIFVIREQVPGLIIVVEEPAMKQVVASIEAKG